MDENMIMNENTETIQSCESIEASTDVVPTPTKKFTMSIKKIISLIGVVCCLIIIILGITTASGNYTRTVACTEGARFSEEPEYTFYSYYGGDAYTGIQHASADASTNARIAAENVAISNKYLSCILSAINYNSRTVSSLVGIVLIAFGLFGTPFFALKFFETDKN